MRLALELPRCFRAAAGQSHSALNQVVATWDCHLWLQCTQHKCLSQVVWVAQGCDDGSLVESLVAKCLLSEALVESLVAKCLLSEAVR